MTLPRGSRGKEMEKLVEEIAADLASFARLRATDFRKGRDTSSSPERLKAEQLITRILQAVADGELDEMLGVVGRGEMSLADIGDYISSMKHIEVEGNVVKVIALRPLTGTGKEEEA